MNLRRLAPPALILLFIIITFASIFVSSQSSTTAVKTFACPSNGASLKLIDKDHSAYGIVFKANGKSACSVTVKNVNCKFLKFEDDFDGNGKARFSITDMSFAGKAYAATLISFGGKISNMKEIVISKIKIFIFTPFQNVIAFLKFIDTVNSITIDNINKLMRGPPTTDPKARCVWAKAKIVNVASFSLTNIVYYHGIRSALPEIALFKASASTNVENVNFKFENIKMDVTFEATQASTTSDPRCAAAFADFENLGLDKNGFVSFDIRNIIYKVSTFKVGKYAAATLNFFYNKKTINVDPAKSFLRCDNVSVTYGGSASSSGTDSSAYGPNFHMLNFDAFVKAGARPSSPLTAVTRFGSVSLTRINFFANTRTEVAGTTVQLVNIDKAESFTSIFISDIIIDTLFFNTGKGKSLFMVFSAKSFTSVAGGITLQNVLLDNFRAILVAPPNGFSFRLMSFLESVDNVAFVKASNITSGRSFYFPKLQGLIFINCVVFNSNLTRINNINVTGIIFKTTGSNMIDKYSGALQFRFLSFTTSVKEFTPASSSSTISLTNCRLLLGKLSYLGSASNFMMFFWGASFDAEPTKPFSSLTVSAVTLNVVWRKLPKAPRGGIGIYGASFTDGRSLPGFLNSMLFENIVLNSTSSPTATLVEPLLQMFGVYRKASDFLMAKKTSSFIVRNVDIIVSNTPDVQKIFAVIFRLRSIAAASIVIDHNRLLFTNVNITAPKSPTSNDFSVIISGEPGPNLIRVRDCESVVVVRNQIIVTHFGFSFVKFGIVYSRALVPDNKAINKVSYENNEVNLQHVFHSAAPRVFSDPTSSVLLVTGLDVYGGSVPTTQYTISNNKISLKDSYGFKNRLYMRMAAAGNPAALGGLLLANNKIVASDNYESDAGVSPKIVMKIAHIRAQMLSVISSSSLAAAFPITKPVTVTIRKNSFDFASTSGCWPLGSGGSFISFWNPFESVGGSVNLEGNVVSATTCGNTSVVYLGYDKVLAAATTTFFSLTDNRIETENTAELGAIASTTNASYFMAPDTLSSMQHSTWKFSRNTFPAHFAKDFCDRNIDMTIETESFCPTTTTTTTTTTSSDADSATTTTTTAITSQKGESTSTHQSVSGTETTTATSSPTVNSVTNQNGITTSSLHPSNTTNNNSSSSSSSSPSEATSSNFTTTPSSPTTSNTTTTSSSTTTLDPITTTNKPLSRTVTLVIPPPAKKRNLKGETPPALAATMLVTGASTPAGYQLTRKILAMQSLASCPGDNPISELPPLSGDDNLLRMTIGDGVLATYRGSIIGNFLLWLAFFVVVLAVAIAYWRYKKASDEHFSFREAACLVRFPGWPLFVIGGVLGPSATTGIGVLASTRLSGGDIGLMVLGLSVLVIAPVALMIWTVIGARAHESIEHKRDQQAEEARKDEVSQSRGNSGGIFFLCSGVWTWLTSLSDEWVSTPFVLQWGNSFDNYVKAWFCVFDLASASALGLMGGGALVCTTTSCCRGVTIVCLIIALLHFLSFIILKGPFNSRLYNFFNFLMSFCTFVEAILALVQQLEPAVAKHAASEYFAMASLITCLTGIVVITVVEIQTWVKDLRAKFREAAEARQLRELENSQGGGTDEMMDAPLIEADNNNSSKHHKRQGRDHHHHQEQFTPRESHHHHHRHHNESSTPPAPPRHSSRYRPGPSASTRPSAVAAASSSRSPSSSRAPAVVTPSQTRLLEQHGLGKGPRSKDPQLAAALEGYINAKKFDQKAAAEVERERLEYQRRQQQRENTRSQKDEDSDDADIARRVVEKRSSSRRNNKKREK